MLCAAKVLFLGIMTLKKTVHPCLDAICSTSNWMDFMALDLQASVVYFYCRLSAGVFGTAFCCS